MTGEQLRVARKSMNMTQKALAFLFEVHPDYIRKMEAGEKTISRRTEMAVRYLQMQQDLPKSIRLEQSPLLK